MEWAVNFKHNFNFGFTIEAESTFEFVTLRVKVLNWWFLMAAESEFWKERCQYMFKVDLDTYVHVPLLERALLYISSVHPNEDVNFIGTIPISTKTREWRYHLKGFKFHQRAHLVLGPLYGINTKILPIIHGIQKNFVFSNMNTLMFYKLNSS